MGFSSHMLPSLGATVQALAIGILIPLFSAILPIKVALSKTLAETLS